jgi:hypothetical protein
MNYDSDESTHMQITIELKKFFVYELIDPRDNKVFYVGMGQGRREYDHKPGESGLKERRILDIEKDGLEVKRIIIGRYDTRAEALSVETTLIKWVYGLDELTNIDPGKYHIFVRPAYHKIKGEYPHITGIDRQRMLNSNTGEYTAAQRQQIEGNNIYEKLETINQYLSSVLHSEVRVSEPNIKKPQDPHLHIHGFSEHISIVLKLRLSGKDCTLAYIPISNSKVDKDSFEVDMKHIFGNNIALSKGNIFQSAYLLIKKESGSPDTTDSSNLSAIKNKLEMAIKQLR